MSDLVPILQHLVRMINADEDDDEKYEDLDGWLAIFNEQGELWFVNSQTDAAIVRSFELKIELAEVVPHEQGELDIVLAVADRSVDLTIAV